MSSKLISIVVPCHNEEKNLPILLGKLLDIIPSVNAEDSTPRYTFELIIIDDGSQDETLGKARLLAQESHLLPIRYASFSRNFGKEAALFAGLTMAKGDYVVTMDADMQDPPSLLPKMISIIEKEGCDSVATRRVTRKGEPPIRSLCARIFYKLINSISDTEIMDGARDYRLMTRQMVEAVLSIGEYNRFSKGIFSWVGFKTTWIEFENAQRLAGESSWSFLSLLLYSIEGITAFSTVPLQLASIAGILLFMFALALGLVIVAKTLLFGDPVSGWPSLACLVLFVGGLQLLCVGIMGQYLAKTYMETKHRPIYILKETNDDNER